MIYVDVLIIWPDLAAISVVVDLALMFRCLSGREGQQALAGTRATAERAGGLRRWIMISLLLDIFAPWIMWQSLLIASRGDEGE